MGLKQAKQEESKEVVVKTHEKKIDGSFTTKKAEERQREIDRLRRERIKEIDRLNRMIDANNLTRNYFKEAEEQGEIDAKGKKVKKPSKKKKLDGKDKKTTSVKKKEEKASKSPTKKVAKSTDRKDKKDKEDKKAKEEKTDKKEKKDDKKKVASKSEDKKEKKGAEKTKKETATTTKKTTETKKEEKAEVAAGKKAPVKLKKEVEEEEPVDEVEAPKLIGEAEPEPEDDDINIGKWDPKFTKEQELFFKKFMNQKITQKFPTSEQKVFADLSNIFSESERTKLKTYFDTQKSNERVGIMAFIKLPAILNSPVNDYIVNSLDKELRGRRITFNEFLSYLSILHPLCPSEFKNAYIFSMIDKEDKGYIDKADVMALIARISKVNMDSTDSDSGIQVEKIKNFVKQVFLTYDITGNGKMDKSMFIKALAEPDVGKIVTLTSLDLSKIDVEPEIEEMADNPA